MRVLALLLSLFVAFALGGDLALAHHSLGAEFDAGKTVRVTGTVTNVDWMNPHTYFFVDVKDPEAKKVLSWACQLASPNELAKRGFNRDTLKVGMAVTVSGTRAKDGSLKIHTETLSIDKTVILGR
jgi:hypothetical protein